MDRTVGDYLENCLNEILEYYDSLSGEKIIPKKNFEQLKHKFTSPQGLKRLSNRLYDEGIILQSVKFDKKQEGFQLYTDILKSASEYFCYKHNLDLRISEEELNNESSTSLIFEKNGVRDIRILFDAYTNFLRNPEKYPKFFGALLNEYVGPYIKLKKHDFGIEELEETEWKKLENIMDKKEDIILDLIEKQGLKIHSVYSEDKKIYLITDMFQKEAERIVKELEIPIKIQSFSGEGYYFTELISDVEHAYQMVNVADIYVNLINPPQ
jgi:hypothetical protein